MQQAPDDIDDEFDDEDEEEDIPTLVEAKKNASMFLFEN